MNVGGELSFVYMPGVSQISETHQEQEAGIVVVAQWKHQSVEASIKGAEALEGKKFHANKSMLSTLFGILCAVLVSSRRISWIWKTFKRGQPKPGGMSVAGP